MSAADDEFVEETLFIYKAVNIWKIPPRAGLASYRAADWVEPHAKLIATCRIKVLSRGKDATIRLEEARTGEFFAETPVRQPLDKYVEPVLDSSRYFVLRLEESDGKNHAFVGMGFEERSPAFDFNVALQDHLKHVNREEKSIDWGPSQDLSLKPGQSLQINIKMSKKYTPSSSSTSTPNGFLSLEPAPSTGGSKRRAQMEAAAGSAAAGPANQAAQGGSGEADWADFGDFQGALATAGGEGGGVDGFGDFGGSDDFGAFGESSGGGDNSFADFEDSTDWAAALAQKDDGPVESRGRGRYDS